MATPASQGLESSTPEDLRLLDPVFLCSNHLAEAHHQPPHPRHCKNKQTVLLLPLGQTIPFPEAQGKKTEGWELMGSTVSAKTEKRGFMQSTVPQ